MTDLLVLHAIGDTEGGAPWIDALDGSEMTVRAPDLPGHGAERPSVDGTYTTGMVLLAAARSLVATGATAPVVLGVGASGWVALVLGLAGRASAVAVLDGLGGPWRDGEAAVADGVAWARRLMDDPSSMAPVPSGGTDPRLGHPAPPFSNERVARLAVGALRVPLLVMSSPADPLPDGERKALLAAKPDPATWCPVASSRPDDVVAPLRDWVRSVVSSISPPVEGP